jgi:hypothetical protein
MLRKFTQPQLGNQPHHIHAASISASVRRAVLESDEEPDG